MKTSTRATAGAAPSGRWGRRLWTRWAGPAVAGLMGTATTTLGLAILHTAWPAVPFVPVVIAQRLVRIASGSVASFFIDLLGHWAARLALLGTCAGFVLAGMAAGVVVDVASRRSAEGGSDGRPTRSRSSLLWSASLLPLWAVSVAMYVSFPRTLTRGGFALATLPIYAAGGRFAGWVRERLMVTERHPRAPTDITRRFLVRSLALGGAGVALGVVDLGRLIHRRADPGGALLSLPNVTAIKARTPTPSDEAFAHIPGLTPELTSIANHYVVDEEFIDPDIDPLTWRLSVGGLVDRPIRLTYQELKAMAAVERYQTLECISNKIGGNLISTARWTGVPLPEILDRAGVKPGAAEVVFRAAGGYSDSLSIDQAMDESTLIAIGMNGHVLPRAHGFPARLLSVGTYGMKNPKWLQSIEVVEKPYLGFWEQRGWVKPAIVKTESRIDTPIYGGEVPSAVSVAGIAFAGDRGVSRVEVSTDGGSSWNEAQLRTALGPYTWRQWLYRWTPPRRGDYSLLVRAYDAKGAPQTATVADTFPSGASGYDRIMVSY